MKDDPKQKRELPPDPICPLISSFKTMEEVDRWLTANEQNDPPI
jgi:hypothetical protein